MRFLQLSFLGPILRTEIVCLEIPSGLERASQPLGESARGYGIGGIFQSGARRTFGRVKFIEFGVLERTVLLHSLPRECRATYLRISPSTGFPII